MSMSEIDASDPLLAVGFMVKYLSNNNTNLSNTENQSAVYDYFDYMYNKPDDHLFAVVVKWLDFCMVPVITSIGIIGNVVSFIVFTCTYLKRMSSSVYLAGLAASDTVFLVIVFMAWLYNVNIFIYHTLYWCQIFVYLAYVSSFLSVWYVVSFTVERYISVAYPFKRQSMCTTKRAKIVIISLALVAVVLYTFALWTSNVMDMYEDGKPYCMVMPQYHDLVNMINNVDTLITLIIPTVLILGSNFRIAIELAQFYHSRELMAEAEWQNAVQSGNLISDRDTVPHSLNINSSYYRLQMKVTKMLLIVSSVFLLCNIPCHSVRVYAYVMTLIDKTYQPSYHFVITQKLLLILYYMNFSVHFLLYNISGKAFRRALVRLCKRIKSSCAQHIFTKRDFSISCFNHKEALTICTHHHRRRRQPDVFD